MISRYHVARIEALSLSSDTAHPVLHATSAIEDKLPYLRSRCSQSVIKKTRIHAAACPHFTCKSLYFWSGAEEIRTPDLHRAKRRDGLQELSTGFKIAAKARISFMMLFPSFQVIDSGCCKGAAHIVLSISRPVGIYDPLPTASIKESLAQGYGSPARLSV